jgi:TetR/AcrR family transcriptional repressor of lmrAB and yxaGH operons
VRAVSQGPRERLITAAVELVREHGVEGAGLSGILERSNTARRPVYQHFPGGKLELIDASTRVAGEWTQLTIRELGATMDASELLPEMIRLLSADLVAGDYRLGCPIAAAAAASADASAVQEAAGAAFDGWVEEIGAVLVREGREREEARSLAGFAVSSVEGTLLCARATRSTEPLRQAGEHLATLLRRT